MNETDLIYLSTTISKTCGIPVRIYEKDKCILFYHGLSFPKDPFILHLEELNNINTRIKYIITSDFFYYTILKYENYLIIFGPFRLIKPDNVLINKIANELSLTKNETELFSEAIKTINCLPLETVLQAICAVNFCLNGEMISISDLTIDNLDDNMAVQESIHHSEKNDEQIIHTNNTYIIEKELCRIVEHGEVDELKTWIKNIPAVRGGILSNDAIRHVKNTFVATATIISRAAIKGNMDPDEALSLSDLYIQNMELLNTSSQITSLQLNMIMDYAERVAKINGKKDASQFLVCFNKYVLAHLSAPIKTPDICNALYVSKSVLFSKIRKETGMTVSNYILSIKINESKSLLKYTNQSISSISSYLGFSSQSHFNHTFKKITNMTPIAYRLSHK